MKTIDHASNDSGAGILRQVMTRAGDTLIESRRLSRVSRLALAGLLCLLSLTWPAQAQTSCTDTDSCPTKVAQVRCPTPGTTLPGNDVTFAWCNANADYFLDIESIPGAHDIFYAFVPAQNFVHLINVPTNGATIYVMLWTSAKGGAWSNAPTVTYIAAGRPPPRLVATTLGTNGHFQFIISGVTPGNTNVVQTSTDLITWVPLLITNDPVNTEIMIDDATATNSPQRFYRDFEIR